MLSGKRAVVTGGGRDFGQAVSVWLAREGVDVDICARQLVRAQGTQNIIRILLTRALLPSLRLSDGADIIVMVSMCGIPQFTQSSAHPAFFAAKQGIGGFCHNIAHHLAEEDIRVTGLYPPDFEMSGLDDAPSERPGRAPLNARSVWETIRFVLQQPRSCHINAIHF